MHVEEADLIEEICKKYDLEPRYFKELFEVEKKYANRNMGRRRGIFKDIERLIDSWMMNK